MNPLRQRMLEDMRIRNFALTTQETYLRQVAYFARHYRKSPERLGLPEIRDLSRELGLPTWDKPAFACLSSRFQYGDRITAEKLRQVDAAESFVRSLGFRQFRVRHHDRLARLEIPLEEIPRLWQEGRHEAIVTRFRELGYLYVAVDLAGFQSGSANLLLALKRSPRG